MKRKQGSEVTEYLVLTYNLTSPTVKRAIISNWNLLHINQEFKRRCLWINDLLGCKNIVDGKLLGQSKKKKIGFSTKCLSKSGNLWGKQALHKQFFKSIEAATRGAL